MHFGIFIVDHFMFFRKILVFISIVPFMQFTQGMQFVHDSPDIPKQVVLGRDVPEGLSELECCYTPGRAREEFMQAMVLGRPLGVSAFIFGICDENMPNDLVIAEGQNAVVIERYLMGRLRLMHLVAKEFKEITESFDPECMTEEEKELRRAAPAMMRKEAEKWCIEAVSDSMQEKIFAKNRTYLPTIQNSRDPRLQTAYISQIHVETLALHRTAQEISIDEFIQFAMDQMSLQSQPADIKGRDNPQVLAITQHSQFRQLIDIAEKLEKNQKSPYVNLDGTLTDEFIKNHYAGVFDVIFGRRNIWEEEAKSTPATSPMEKLD